LMSRPRRVLIVDDDTSIVELLQQYFESSGYHVEIALHGGDALTLIQHDPPDVVLLDIAMPGMDGVQVLQRILALEAAPPVIIVTGHEEGTLAARTRAMGAVDYITKPFALARIGQAVDAALASGSNATDEPADP
jgi:DNA-binding response OmpR family regulator